MLRQIKHHVNVFNYRIQTRTQMTNEFSEMYRYQFKVLQPYDTNKTKQNKPDLTDLKISSFSHNSAVTIQNHEKSKTETCERVH